jgi:CheY-like chemotaxis protein
MKIMIVDDHQEIRRLLRSALTHLADIRECGDGSEAIAAFAQERPDWTVMDVAMKGIDGLEATRRIKASFPDARILVLTQHDSPGVRQAARDAGATAFLSKDQLTEIAQVLSTPENLSQQGRTSSPLDKP